MWRLSIDPNTHLCDRKFLPLCQRCRISGVPIMAEAELTEFIRSSLLMPKKLDINLLGNTVESAGFSVPKTDPSFTWLYLVTAVKAICSDQ